MKNYIGISRDHSGSMSMIALAAGRDYNDNIAAIKEGAAEHNIDTIVSVVKCGTGRPAKVVREVVNSNINMLKPIPDGKYIADGNSTPLFDSVGDLIEQLQAVPDADDPDVSFVVMVITDGQENSSQKWTGGDIAKKIKELQATDRWTFAFRVPKGEKRDLMRYGIPEGNILEWDQTDRGVQAASVATRSAVKGFYAARSAGVKSTDKFYADLSSVTLKEVKASLVDISNEVDIYKVKPAESGMQIRDFVEQRTRKAFVKGSAFYQLSKTETVQEYKQLAIRDKVKGTVYSGFAARDMLGLPQYGEVKLAPGSHGQYDIFIQSTSFNRKLVENTNVLVWTNITV
jgi:hypothetical protein